VASDNVHMLKIVGSPNGRVFMCGKDGCVYELHYQPEDGWIHRKCRKLNRSHGRLQSMLPSFIFGSGEDPICMCLPFLD
jgi:nuclear pore complex protein Nup155